MDTVFSSNAQPASPSPPHWVFHGHLYYGMMNWKGSGFLWHNDEKRQGNGGPAKLQARRAVLRAASAERTPGQAALTDAVGNSPSDILSWLSSHSAHFSHFAWVLCFPPFPLFPLCSGF